MDWVRPTTQSFARWALVGLIAISLTVGGAARGEESDSLEQGLAALVRGEPERAAELLTQSVAELSLQPDSPRTREKRQRAMVGAGQALRQLRRHRQAIEFFQGAIDLGDTSRRVMPIQLAIAQCHLDLGDHAAAAAVCESLERKTMQPRETLTCERIVMEACMAMGKTPEAWDAFQRLVNDERSLIASDELAAWAPTAQSIGLHALERNQLPIAEAAFQWYIRFAAEDASRETATLGLAWVAAKGADSLALAAQRLGEFIERYPHSEQIPQALLARAGCLRKTNQIGAALSTYQELVVNYPASSEAARGLVEMTDLSSAIRWDTELLAALRTMALSPTLNARTSAALLPISASVGDQELWSSTLNRFVEMSDAHTVVSALLTQLEQMEQKSWGIELAHAVAVTSEGGLAPEPVIEKVCRWAASTQRWQVVEHVAGNATDGDLAFLNTLSIRLMAEAQMQSGRSVDARKLFRYLIVNKQVNDFDTLLRNAELALVLDTKAEAAEAIRVAGQAATRDEDARLIAIVKAQWLVRDIQFDQSRALLSEVLNDMGTPASLRARTQWLIGETYLIQQRFEEAIDAYRAVEAWDETGNWTAASMAQAGRALEQLGRTRDATICYTGLLKRFPESPYATNARQRLATIGEQSKLR